MGVGLMRLLRSRICSSVSPEITNKCCVAGLKAEISAPVPEKLPILVKKLSLVKFEDRGLSLLFSRDTGIGRVCFGSFAWQ